MKLNEVVKYLEYSISVIRWLLDSLVSFPKFEEEKRNSGTNKPNENERNI